MAVFGLLAGCEPAPSESTFTSISAADCMVPTEAIVASYKQRDLGVQQCPAPDGWELFVVSSDANSWIELRRGNVSWSAEDAIVYQTPIGNFPSVGGSLPLEWRRGMSGAEALILPVAAQDPADDKSRIARLFVVRLEPSGACLVGRVVTQDEAQRLADAHEACPATKAP
jgi:hypothetical protein